MVVRPAGGLLNGVGVPDAEAGPRRPVSAPNWTPASWLANWPDASGASICTHARGGPASDYAKRGAGGGFVCIIIIDTGAARVPEEWDEDEELPAAAEQPAMTAWRQQNWPDLTLPNYHRNWRPARRARCRVFKVR